MQAFLRDWRQDALQKHQYESAIYIGDKLLALTKNPADAFFLAQVHFSTGNYSRAFGFLEKHDLTERGPAARYLAANCLVRQDKFEEALTILGDKSPSHLIISPSKTRRKLLHLNGGVTGKHSSDGRANGRPDRIEKSEEREQETISDIKYEAAMCYLRGICFAKQNAFDRAKECYKDAVRIDIQCFEAFDQLMKNKLMSPDEEWEFLESLDFDTSISSTSNLNADSDQETAQFVKMLYTTRLSKYKNPTDFSHATETLSTHYNLASNADLLLAKAELLFTQCRFKQSLAITSTILEEDPYNFIILPLHLASLNELGKTSTLFLLSHRLADTHPEEPSTWLAVGVYYLSTGQVAEARRFFSKASMMDPHFGPAWIGFAHTFAAEGEHDQAISAYSTAARLFQGTHLPQLFLGMQNLLLGNMGLAHGYLTAAHALCKTDPLLLNEMGVVYYHLDHLPDAIMLFTQALEIADDIDSDPKAWIATRANLGHAYRRQGNFEAALEQFDEVLRQGQGSGAGNGSAAGVPGAGNVAMGSREYGNASSNMGTYGSSNNGSSSNVGIFSAKGLVLLELGRTWEAICAFHEALGVQPQDPIATDLLSRALEENAYAASNAIGNSFINRGQAAEMEAEAEGAMNLDDSGSVPARNGIQQQGIAPDDAEFNSLIERAKQEAFHHNSFNSARGSKKSSSSTTKAGIKSKTSHTTPANSFTGSSFGTASTTPRAIALGNGRNNSSSQASGQDQYRQPGGDAAMEPAGTAQDDLQTPVQRDPAQLTHPGASSTGYDRTVAAPARGAGRNNPAMGRRGAAGHIGPRTAAGPGGGARGRPQRIRVDARGSIGAVDDGDEQDDDNDMMALTDGEG